MTAFTTKGLAYHALPGRSPGVIFFGGFMSNMNGTKALALEAWCRAQGLACTRFDYSAHGESPGEFQTSTIGRWVEDALSVFDEVAQGEQILIGSSMGGWIATRVALARIERVRGLIGIAAAPDFVERLIYRRLPAAMQRQLAGQGFLTIPTPYGEFPYPMTQAFLEDSRRHHLLDGPPLALPFPVRLLHGMQDADVPWTHSLLFAENIASADIQVTLVKDGDHRLSRDSDLALLTQTTESLLSVIGLS